MTAIITPETGGIRDEKIVMSAAFARFTRL